MGPKDKRVRKTNKPVKGNKQTKNTAEVRERKKEKFKRERSEVRE